MDTVLHFDDNEILLTMTYSSLYKCTNMDEFSQLHLALLTLSSLSNILNFNNCFNIIETFVVLMYDFTILVRQIQSINQSV